MKMILLHLLLLSAPNCDIMGLQKVCLLHKITRLLQMCNGARMGLNQIERDISNNKSCRLLFRKINPRNQYFDKVFKPHC